MDHNLKFMFTLIFSTEIHKSSSLTWPSCFVSSFDVLKTWTTLNCKEILFLFVKKILDHKKHGIFYL